MVLGMVEVVMVIFIAVVVVAAELKMTLILVPFNDIDYPQM